MFPLSSTTVPDDSVKVILECIGAPGSVSGLKYPTRQLRLTTGERPITIGRASKNTSKNIQPNSKNAFFDCAVMSRNHAEMYLQDGTKGNVALRDTGSLHGTFVNDIKVGNDFNIYQGDIIRFGDKVSRLVAIHDGIEVRVRIERPNAMASSSMTSQATLTGSSMPRTNTYAVPSESSDDQPPKESGLAVGEDEDADDYEDVTPSDDDGIRSVEFVSATRSFPLSQKYANNDKPANYDRSQTNPVMIDDEVYHAQDDPDDESDSDSEVEYDNGGSRSPGSDAESRNGSIRSQRYSPSSPRAYAAKPSRSDDEESNDSDMSEDDCPPKQAGGVKVPDAAPPAKEQTTSTTSICPSARTMLIPETLKLAPIMPPHSASFNESLAPITQVPNYAANSGFGKPESLSPTYVDIYERNAPGQHTEYRSPFSLRGHDVLPTYVYNPPHERTISTAWHYGGTSHDRDGFKTKGEAAADKWGTPFDQTNSWAPDVDQLNKNCNSFPPIDPATKAAEPAPAAVEEDSKLAKPAIDFPANDKVEQAPTVAEVNSDSKKRKREVIDEDEVEEHKTNENGDAAWTETIDEIFGMNFASDDVTLKIQDSPYEMVEVSKPSDSESAGAIEPLVVTRPAVSPAVTHRPTKRARTSSVSLALTAAVGAVSGCVATVGFLWSPLAERLLA